MSYLHKIIQPILGLFLMAASLTACGLSGGPASGKVIDAATNEPVEGAIVVARWIGHLATWAHGSTNCYHVESTMTDSKGEFHIPEWEMNYTEDWQKNVSPRYVDITAYRPGYQLSPRQIEEQSHLKGVYYIEPINGSIAERLEYLQKISRTTGCNSAGESEKNMLLLQKALYSEAEQLTKVKDDKKTLEDLLYAKEIIELGYETAQKRHLERLGTKK